MINPSTRLIAEAIKVQGRFALNDDGAAGSVSAAILTSQGNIYTGICIDITCGIGTCAEHAAVAEMLKHRETQIEMIVAVKNQTIIPPCGRCRELLLQVDARNIDSRILLDGGQSMTLSEMLPHPWLTMRPRNRTPAQPLPLAPENLPTILPRLESLKLPHREKRQKRPA
ncbi:cytidine deaminase [Phragmitibacter flavus]|uniref:Cytidine deaminase n=1 Tax=Phragmitibacter flavus TaxID=2576071 RepID=A0A5R8K754_9BACT|nr:cytidine deaminase [Phragmitibacter flavus]TLD68201.1 cytidine deaminase [Phragmitibacter flavus]